MTTTGKLSYRTWVRDLSSDVSIKKIEKEVKNPSNKKNSMYLLKKTKEFDPTIKNISGSKGFALAVANAIEKGLNWKVLKDSFGQLKAIAEASKSYGKFGSSLEDIYKWIRRPIREKYGEDSGEYRDSIRLMKFSPELWAERQKAYKEKVVARNRDRIIFKGSQVFEIMQHIADNGTKWADLAVLCILASGSRSDEIISLAKYSEGLSEHYVRQDGIAKQDHKPKEKQRTFVEKPIVYITREKFLESIASIRVQLMSDIKKYKGDHYGLSNSKNGTLNRAVQKYFGFKEKEDNIKINSHGLRGIYASVAWQTYGDPSKESESAFLNTVLGHDLRDLSVATSYSHYYVDLKSDDGKTPSEIQTEVKAEASNDKIEELTQQIEDLKLSINSKGCMPVKVCLNVSKNTCARDGKTKERMMKSIKEMEEKGIAVTRSALISLNYGSRVVSEYLREKKQECEPYARCRNRPRKKKD